MICITRQALRLLTNIAIKPLYVFAVISILLVGCGGSDSDDVREAIDQVPTIAPIESVVKTGVPLSYAATIAMAIVHGAAIPNASASNQCTGYPCVSTVLITVQPNDLPVELSGIADNGEIFVVGLWSSATQAIMTVVFNDIDAGNQFLSARKISTIPVSQQNNVITLAYSNIDIDIESESEVAINLSNNEIQNEYDRLNQNVDMDPEININMDAWLVETRTGGTSSDLSDDEYIILGGGQYFEAGSGQVSVLQIGGVGIQVTQNCALNPTGGNAVLQEVNVSTGDRSTWPIIGQAIIEFRSSCDGTARVLLGTGSFFLASGDDIDLGFAN